MIKEKLLKNEDILKFLNNYYYNNRKNKNPYNLIFLADGIFINEATDDFFQQFRYSLLKTLLSFSFSKFIERVILNINKLDDFIYLFKIFLPKNNNKMEANIIDTIVNCLWQIIEKEDNIENSQKFNEIMTNIILIYVYNNYKYEGFLNQLNNKGIKKDIIKKFYLWIISYYGKEYKEFVYLSLNFIWSDKTDTNFEVTINLFRQLKNNVQTLFLYFNNINISQKAIKEIDFKKSSITSNFRILSLLVEKSFFEDTIKEK